MEEKESPLPSILLIVLFCTLVVLLGYAYLFNNDFFYSFCGGKSFWCSASQLLCSFPPFFHPQHLRHLCGCALRRVAWRASAQHLQRPAVALCSARRHGGGGFGIRRVGSSLPPAIKRSVLDREDGEDAGGGTAGQRGGDALRGGDLPRERAGSVLPCHGAALLCEVSVVRPRTLLSFPVSSLFYSLTPSTLNLRHLSLMTLKQLQ